MKSLKVLLPLIVLAAVAAAPSIRAEDTSSSSAEVKLTPAQEAKIADLRKAEHKALKALKDDKKTKEADKKAKAKAIKDDYKAQIDAVKAGK